MKPGLVSSAAYEIQLTADCELPLYSAARGRSRGGACLGVGLDGRPGKARPTSSPQLVGRSGALEKAADGLAGDAEADDLAGGIDVGDRVGRDQAAVA